LTKTLVAENGPETATNVLVNRRSIMRWTAMIAAIMTIAS